MSATNEFLPFSQDGAALVLSQGAYSSDGQRPIGNQPGIARAQLVNKALRQSTVMAAAVGQFIAARQASTVADTVSATTLADYLRDALAIHGTLPGLIGGSAQSWWRRSPIDGYTELGVSGISVPASGGYTDVTFPIAFPTTVVDVQIGVVSAAQQQLGWSDAALTSVRIYTGVGDPNPRIANIIVRGW